MRPVSVSIELKYACELADSFAESLPIVRVFWDAHFNRTLAGGGIVNIPLDENNRDTVYATTLNASIHGRAGPVPPTASIGFASFALRRNRFGQLCYVDVGTNHVELSAIASHLREGRGPYERELPLVMHTTKQIGTNSAGIEKGKLLLRITSLDMGQVEFVSGPTPLRASLKSIDNTLVSYIKSTMDQQGTMRDTIPGTDRVHAPMDISESGIELTKSIYLPVAAYAMFETPESNLHYWTNVFDRVMARQGLRGADYHEFDRAHKASTMVKMMIYEAETFDYVGDEVDRNERHARAYDVVKKAGYENFGDATVTTSGDCEDSACTIQQTFRSFMAFRFDPSTHRELAEMQTIGRQYVPMLTLAVVHGQKADDDESAPKGAHMYVTFLTQHQVRKALSKTSQGRESLRTLPWDNRMEIDTDLPTLFGEGTGMIDPLGRVDPMLEQRRYMARSRTLAAFKKEIPHKRGAPSEFYLGNMLGITSEFFSRGGNVGGFVFGTVNDKRNRRGEAEMTRGTLWTKVINQSETMAMMPQPPIPKPVMDLMREATALRVPPNPMVLDKEMALGEEINPLLDQLVHAVAQQHQNSPSSGGGGGGTVDIYMRPHQFDQNTIHAMIDEMMQLDRVYAVDYELEHVTNSLYQYRVMFSVN
jgi:hypothetical protein